MDDPAFLLAHVRTAFITSDETGVSELVMESEDNHNRFEKKRSYSFVRKDKGPSSPMDIDLSQSPDIVPGMDYGHRFRSNTVQRLEKLLTEKQKQSKIQHITWKCGENPSKEDLDEMFVTQEVKKVKCKKSRLGQLLEEFDKMAASNAFSNYVKFDGQGFYQQGCNMVKSFDIFLNMLSQPERSYPMTVNITVANAKVEDLIGLICWQYSLENKEPELKPSVNKYSLYMVEDNGDVDYDFPPLDPQEPISKFSFAKLALVEDEHNDDADTKPCLKSKESNKDKLLITDIDAVVENKSKLPILRDKKQKGTLSSSPPPLLPALTLPSSYPTVYTLRMLHRYRHATDVKLEFKDSFLEIQPYLKTPSSTSSSSKRMEETLLYDYNMLSSCTVNQDGKRTSHAHPVLRLVVRLTNGKVKEKSFECDYESAKLISDKIDSIINTNLNKT